MLRVRSDCFSCVEQVLRVNVGAHGLLLFGAWWIPGAATTAWAVVATNPSPRDGQADLPGATLEVTAHLPEVAKVDEAPKKSCFDLGQQVSLVFVRTFHGPVRGSHARRRACTVGPRENWHPLVGRLLPPGREDAGGRDLCGHGRGLKGQHDGHARMATRTLQAPHPPLYYEQFCARCQRGR